MLETVKWKTQVLAESISYRGKKVGFPSELVKEAERKDAIAKTLQPLIRNCDTGFSTHHYQ